MRRSEFHRLVTGEFGDAYGPLLLRTHALRDLGDRTGEQALDDGVDPRTVWTALCDDMEVPADRRLGEDLPIRENL